MKQHIEYAPQRTVDMVRLGELASEMQRQYADAYREAIEPLYGDQSYNIERLLRGDDRETHILMVDGEMMGTLIYKKALQDEYGARQAFEIKTLCLFSEGQNSGRGYAAQLLDVAEQAAMKLGAQSMFVTIAEDRPQVIDFFQKHGFVCSVRLPERHRQSVDELVYIKQVDMSEAV